MKKLLAIDLGTDTGWAWSSNGKQIDESGHWNFTVKKDESTGMRLIRFRGKLNEILKTVGVDLIVFENTVQQFQRRAGAHVQAELQGVMKLWCEENNIQYKGYFPKEIKKHATGKGTSKKEAMILAAQKKWKRVFESDDEADARWILDLAIKDMGFAE